MDWGTRKLIEVRNLVLLAFLAYLGTLQYLCRWAGTYSFGGDATTLTELCINVCMSAHVRCEV